MWYSLKTNSGEVILLNFNNIIRIQKDSTDEIRVIGEDGTVDYQLSSATERDEIFQKIQNILDAKSLNTLPPQ